MEVRIYDEEAENKSISLDELIKQMEEENSKKNFRNWLNNLIPTNGTGYNTYYVLLHPWTLFKHWANEIKWAWQRIFRQWDDRVTWSIDYYIAKMLPLWIEELRNRKLGIPGIMFEGLPYENEENYTHSEESWRIAEKRWNDVLDEIILGFKIYQEKDVFLEGEDKQKFDRAMELFVKYFSNFWD